MRLLIIGSPACGKDTIAAMLSKKTNLKVITPGFLLRSVSKSSQYYDQINKTMKMGGLVDPKIVGRMLFEESQKPDYRDGFILNGWFRQMQDKKYFNPKLDKVLYLKISKETAIRRTKSRRICETGGHTYNLLTNKTKIEGICDIDGSKLVQRQDDKLKTFERRYQIFETETLKVIEYFRKKDILVEINAEGSSEEVYDQVVLKAQL